jgi:hypothetical protein
MTKTRSVSATRVIAAPASRIFDLLADPRQHVLLDGSGTVGDVRRSPDRLFLGARFSMKMKIGATYTTSNVVVAFEEDRCIAWHHIAQFVWRYDLVEVVGGTQVTESFNYDKPWAFAIMVLGYPERNRLSMVKTLERLERAVTS